MSSSASGTCSRIRRARTTSDAGAQLFDYESADGHARMLLLSATPYKMYTLADEADDDHYADFVQTTEFLLRERDRQAFARELRAYRDALCRPRADARRAALRHRKRAVEQRLRRVMARTERLAVDRGPQRHAGAARGCPGVSTRAGDVTLYVDVRRGQQAPRPGDTVEYWKSAPYLARLHGGVRAQAQAA